MAAAPIATTMFAVPVILYIFLALSIPTFFDSWKFPIVAITLATSDGNVDHLNTTTGVNGILNNVTITNLLNIDFGFWTACFQEWDPLATNLKGIKDICLPVVSLGYLVDVEPETTNTFSPTIVFVSYTIPIFFILAWLATLIGTITTGHPHHYIVKGAAVVLTGVSVGSQYVLFTTAKLAAPNLGVTAATSLGVGFYIVTGSLILLVLAIGLYFVETS